MAETSSTLASGNGHALVRFNARKPVRFQPETSYISIAVRSISLEKGRINLSKYAPYLFGVIGQTNFDADTRLVGVFSPAVEDALMAGASAHPGSQIGMPLQEGAGPTRGTGPLRAESFGRLDRVLVVDRQLTPRLVYRGEGPIQLGFGAVRQKNSLTDSLGVLEAVVKSPVAQFVSATAPAIGYAASALDLANSVRKAFDHIGERKGMQRLALLDVNLRTLFDDTGGLQAGAYALIARDHVPGDLTIDAATGRIMTPRGNAYDDAPYVAFDLRCEQNRPDWGSVPEVNAAWRTLEHQYRSGETDGALEAFKRSVFICPDLVPADSQRIYAAARRKLSPLQPSAESFGLPARFGAIGKALRQAYDEVAASPGVAAIRNEWTRFMRCHDIMRVNEGGYVDHPDDPGGATNMGVTQRTYDAWRTRNSKPVRSVRDIQEVEVQQIYFEGYWRAGHCEKMPDDASALVLFDACVNHGNRQAMKFIQRGAGVPSANVDGRYGPQTAAAIARTDPPLLVRRALDARWAFFELIMNRNAQLEAFRRGWRNRVDHLQHLAGQWATGQESIGEGLAPLSPDQIAPPEFGAAPEEASA